VRRRLAAAPFIVLAIASVAAFGLPWRGVNRGWRRVPKITVISREGDARLPVVVEAVAFWNRTFAELGTSFRLGSLDGVTGEIPDGDLRALSTATLGAWLSSGALRGAWLRQHPAPFDRFSGDLLVVLSDAKSGSLSAGHLCIRQRSLLSSDRCGA
jgi:hypothetical protein